MFTVAERDDFIKQVVGLAQADARIVAGAIVGSLAIGAGDRFSDVDLTIVVSDSIESVGDVGSVILPSSRNGTTEVLACGLRTDPMTMAMGER
jgi:hypothetical protein